MKSSSTSKMLRIFLAIGVLGLVAILILISFKAGSNSLNLSDLTGIETEGQEEATTQENPDAMKRYFVENAKDRDAICNDGSDAAYFFKPGEQSDKWVIWTEGGGGCQDEQSCITRMKTQKWLTTSNTTGEYAQKEGILSSDPDINPEFYNWNHVMLNYCSSDNWSGDATVQINNEDFHFNGTHIYQAMFEDLGNAALHEQNLTTASEVILAGTSAGGSGVAYNINRVADWLPHAKLTGVIDSSWSVDFPSLLASEEVIESYTENTIAYRNNQLDDTCLLNHADDPMHCRRISNTYPYFDVPVFIYIDQYDKKKLTSSLGITNTKDPEQRAHADAHAAAIRESLEGLDGVFSPTKTWHGTITNNKLFRKTIDGYSFYDVFTNWYLGDDEPTSLIKE